MKSWSAALLLACITLLDASIVAAQSKAKLPLGLDPDATYIPDDNPMTPEKIALGRSSSGTSVGPPTAPWPV